MYLEIFYSKKIIFFFTFIFPISLISGPAIPDILATIFGLVAVFILIKTKETEIIKSKYIIFFLIFWLYLILSSILSENIFFSLKTSVPYLRLILFSIFIYLMSKNIYFINSLFLGFTASYIILICDTSIILIETNFQMNDMSKPIQITNMFDGERIVGSFLSRTLPLYFGLFLLLKNKYKYKYIIWLITFLSIFIIFLSGERSAIFYSILFIILLFFLFKKLRFLIFLLIIFLSLTFVVTGSYKNIKNRFIDYTVYQIFNNKDKINIFSIGHEELYKTSHEIFKENYIFGSGPNTFRLKCEDYNLENSCSTSAHNIYIQSLSETGIIGFLFLSLVFLILSFFILREFIMRNFLNLTIINDAALLFIICSFINIWPIIPTGNLFHNWINIIYFMPLGLIIYSLNSKLES